MTDTVAESTARYLRFPLADVERLARLAPRSYRRYVVPKKAGGHRLIFHPARRTKALQYALMYLFLPKLPVHAAAMAYRAGLTSPLRKNALLHARFAYTVRVDMKDFFPSIRPDDLFQAWARAGQKDLTDADKGFLSNALFLQYLANPLQLAIGAPASPMVSNAVMHDLDVKFDSFAKSHDGSYTRYADDLVYSTNEKGQSSRFVEFVESSLEACDSPELTMNTAKTLFLSRRGRRTVTGLVISPDGSVSLGRKRKRYIRKLIFEFENGKLKKKMQERLRGQLGFALDCDPAFYNRLVIRYGAETMRSALRAQSG